MKRLILIAALLGSALLAGCPATMQSGSSSASQPSAAEKYQRNAKIAVDAVDQVAKLATQAVNANVLKGADADNVILAIGAARDGLRIADSMAKTDPSGAASKVAWTMGIFGATQTYLAAKGVK